MLERVHHIAIAVRDLDKAVKSWQRLGVEVSYLDHSARNVKVASFRVGETIFELLSPAGGGVLQEHLDAHGEGLYHVAFETTGIDARLDELAGRGVPLRDQKSRPGIAWKVAWLDVEAECGLPSQLIEPDPDVDPERLAAAMGVKPSAGAKAGPWSPQPVPVRGMRPVSGFEPVIRSGPLVFISGQVPVDGDGNLVGRGDITAQVEQVYANLHACVTSAGGRMQDIVRLTTFTVSRDYRVAIRDGRAKWFSGGPLPTSSLVVVSGLAHPDYLLEIEATAVIP